jgi:hypothetical protein
MKELNQSERSKRFVKQVETLVDSGQVKNKLEIVTALDWDKTALSNVLAGRRDVPAHIYKRFTNIYSLDIPDADALRVEAALRIEAKCDVILLGLAEILAGQKGSSVAKIVNEQEELVVSRLKDELEKLQQSS